MAKLCLSTPTVQVYINLCTQVRLQTLYTYIIGCIQLKLSSRGKPCHRHRFGVPMIDQRNLFRIPMIDHRKQFGGEMIALLTGTYFL